MMDNILEVRDLKVWFPVRRGIFSRAVGWVKAVDGVSFDLRRGETLGIVGESGCGKSTTARAVLGLVKPREGTIAFAGKDVRDWPRRAYHRRVQVVFQDPLASLNPRFTVCETVTEAAVAHGLCASRDRRRFAAALLKEVGMGEDALDRYPHEFSGGQRQRVSIARALSLDPELLICDEAVSALDLSVRAQVLDLLGELKRRRNLSILFITHDLGVVRHLADDVVVMEKGRVVESGPCAEVLDHPREAYTRRLLESVPRLP